MFWLSNVINVTNWIAVSVFVLLALHLSMLIILSYNIVCSFL